MVVSPEFGVPGFQCPRISVFPDFMLSPDFIDYWRALRLNLGRRRVRFPLSLREGLQMDDILTCSACSASNLVLEETSARCPDCLANYPVLRGVIDFRNADRDVSAGYDFGFDNLVAQKMLDVFDRVTTANELRTLSDALRMRHLAGTDLANIDAADVLIEDDIGPTPCTEADKTHGRSVIDKCDLYLADAGLPTPPNGVALEDGAGAGYFICGLAERYRRVIVLDLSMSLMIIAVKVAEELNLTNITFVCASAEHLPFANGSIDFVHSNNVIEHVADQGRMIAEADRVLSPYGLFFIISPNRYSIYFEPHFRLPGYGFFPPALRRIIVKRWLGYNTSDVALRSLGELRALLKAHFSGPTRVTFIPRSLRLTVTGGGIRSILTGLLSNPVTGGIVNFAVNTLALPMMPYHVVLGTRPNRQVNSSPIVRNLASKAL